MIHVNEPDSGETTHSAIENAKHELNTLLFDVRNPSAHFMHRLQEILDQAHGNSVQILEKAEAVRTAIHQLHLENSLLKIEELRARLKSAVEESGLTLDEIGKRMGKGDEKRAAKNAVWFLLNRAPDPGLLTLKSFCDAVNIRLSQLLGPDEKKE